MIQWLRRFWPRLLQQLNIAAGVAGIAALILTIAGLIVPGLAKIILIGAGAAIAVVTLIIAVIKAFPPPMRNPAELQGQELQLADLTNLEPPVPAIGLLGDTAVGKTTLKGRLLQQPAQETDSTERVTARIGVLNDPTTYIAILDGRGESLNQQFEVAERSQICLVMLDHNDISEKSHPSHERMAAEANFGSQLRDYLIAHPRSGRRVHLLLNKRDKWQNASEEQQKEIQTFFTEEVGKWRNAFGPEVSCAEHSNDSSADIGALVTRIRSHWQRSQEIVRTQPL